MQNATYNTEKNFNMKNFQNIEKNRALKWATWKFELKTLGALLEDPAVAAWWCWGLNHWHSDQNRNQIHHCTLLFI